MTDIKRDDGAIIGYKPKLEYVKEKTSTAKSEQTTLTNYDGTNYSKTVSNLADNLPSVALENLEFVTDNMKLLIDQLAKVFNEGDWNEYNNIASLISAIDGNNNNYIDDFIDYHATHIEGSIIPELIGTINSTQRRLLLLSSTLKKLYYNNDKLTTDEAREIDNGYLKQIQKYETGNEINKINYLSISQDSILNRSVSLYAFDINEKAINLSEVIVKTDNVTAKQEQSDLIKKLYQEANQELDYRKSLCNEEESFDIMVKSLYNYYDKRKYANEMYTVLDSSKTSVFIAKKTKSYKDKLSEAITNVNKTFAGNTYHVSELTSLEQEKALLMNIYSTFNYNSENK